MAVPTTMAAGADSAALRLFPHSYSWLASFHTRLSCKALSHTIEDIKEGKQAMWGGEGPPLID
jgi:hypothetical protein